MKSNVFHHGRRNHCRLPVCTRRLPLVTPLTRTLICILLTATALNAAADTPDSLAALGPAYQRDIRPLLEQFCLDCHSTEQQEGDLDLQQFIGLEQVQRDPKAWQKVDQMLASGEMPPEDGPQPSAAQRQTLRAWVQRYLAVAARQNAGDPGHVVLRRLDNAEYKYTLRDLTQIDLDPTREFPSAGSSGEGFTNTGDALAMSPALLQKYLLAGKQVAGHAVLLPDGFRFSLRTTRRDWTDEILNRLRAFYGQFVDSQDLGSGLAVGYVNGHVDTRLGEVGRLPLEKYFAATLAERKALAEGSRTIAEVARQRGLNARYLATLWSSVSGSTPSEFPGNLPARWRAAQQQDAAALAAHVARWQRGLWRFNPIGLQGRQGSASRWLEPVDPLLTEEEFRFAIPELAEGETTTEIIISLVATDAGDGNRHDDIVWQRPRLVKKGEDDLLLRDLRCHSAAPTGGPAWGLNPARFGKHSRCGRIDSASLGAHAPSVITVRLPASLAAGRELVTTATLHPRAGKPASVQVDVIAGTPATTCGLLPSEVTVNYSQVTQIFSAQSKLSFARPILIHKDNPVRARLLTAFANHRRLFPAALCYTQITPVDELHTTTIFYREDDHLERLMLDEQQQARVDRLWQELRYVSQADLLRLVALRDMLHSMEPNRDQEESQYDGIEPLLEPLTAGAATFGEHLVATEASHLEALIDFAERAYRRPLTGLETNELRGLYQRLRDEELSHDDAFRLTLARVFVATPFLFRLEKAPPIATTAAVSDWELASRLSYFLWSSQPDAPLRRLAAAGQLHQPGVLAQQAARMLRDPRVRRLATEFTCQWLDIYDFADNDEKSEQMFPQFADLRADMYEESIRFFTDLFTNDGSMLDLLAADHTFLNESLARHYGIGGVQGPAWRRVTGVGPQGRGGILTMASVLAKQSGAARTSPILRGNWIYETLLGEHLPKPPANVPLLPEAVPAGLTARQLIEQHSSDPQCAKCHRRIDPYGFALEQYDAIGRLRKENLDTRTRLADGSSIDGLAGLQQYLLQQRKDDFLRQFCRKLLGYSLGRAVQLSDEPLLQEIEQQLAGQGARFSVAVQTIVQSQQFREIRGRQMASN